MAGGESALMRLHKMMSEMYEDPQSFISKVDEISEAIVEILGEVKVQTGELLGNEAVARWVRELHIYGSSLIQALNTLALRLRLFEDTCSDYELLLYLTGWVFRIEVSSEDVREETIANMMARFLKLAAAALKCQDIYTSAELTKAKVVGKKQVAIEQELVRGAEESLEA